MFEGFVEQRRSGGLARRGGAFLLSGGLHVGIVALVLFISVQVTQQAAEEEVPVLFYAPPPPPPPPPPPASATVKPKVTKKPKVKKPEIVQPKKEEVKPLEPEPEEPEPEPEPEPEEVEEEAPAGVVGGVVGGVEGGVVGGVVGGQVGGVLGGQLGGSETPVRLKRGMIPPKVIKSTMVEPEFPRFLREARISGRVLLVITVLSSGRVGDVKVRSGNPALAKAAVQAIKKWRFKPAMYNGRPIAVLLPYPFIFKITR